MERSFIKPMDEYQELRINFDRFKKRLNEINRIGAMEGGGVCRLSLSDEDKAARDLLKRWTQELDIELEIDQIGNMFLTLPGETNEPCVMTGSHLDTVGTGGLFDGPLGVLGGLEIIETLRENRIRPKRTLKVANFTNEEGVRFTPDMMGSLAFKKGISIDELHGIESVDGKVLLGDELIRIGYKGKFEPGHFPVSAFVEIHIEQGPILENEGLNIGAVTKVQGIYWTEYTILGRAAHAGTTPIELRKDAGLVAAQLTAFVREKANELDGVGTVGITEVSPNLINVVPEKVRLTTDLRHPEKEKLKKFQSEVDEKIKALCDQENTRFERKERVRFDPVDLSGEVAGAIQEQAQKLGFSSKRMISGAGHDAQMMAAICPTSMIFVPSVDGISHNIEEFTKDEDLDRGINVLLHVMLDLANR
ncbi:MAG TPA: Zn-dependent hydrolase [Gracilimonas sp.]|uniref:Zn-dependent hydrolase n=1 Tax=Gracilimonas sp. TaxID=1974203 RepID=UPI002DAE18A9|nr:Zn-dependent hydrolase [Gracilimonas sp.]